VGADILQEFAQWRELVVGEETVGHLQGGRLRPVPKQPSRTRPVGIDRGMIVPPSFFEPLPENLLDAFEGGGDSG